MKKGVATLIVAFGIAVAAQGQSTPTPIWPLEPKDFRGIPFGTSKNEAAKKFDFEKCFYSVSGPLSDELVCVEREPFSFGDAKERISFIFDSDNRFVSVIFISTPTDFAGIRDIFVARYGPPTRIEIKKPTDATGVEIITETDDWDGDAVNVHISKVASLTAGFAISDKSWQAKKKAAAEAARKKVAATF